MTKQLNAPVAKAVLDAAVRALRAIPDRLYGDDSPLTDPWEEIKDQVQSELSPYWPAYLETIRATVDGQVATLLPGNRTKLAEELKMSPDNAVGICHTCVKRLLAKAKREKISYAPFGFTHFRYRIGNMTVYARVLERTGTETCKVIAYSGAAPGGEAGKINPDVMDDTMTEEEFENARTQRWPNNWE